MSELARAARAMPAAGGSEASASDLLLDGFTARAAVGYLAGAPLFRRAIAMLRADDLSPQEGLHWLGLGCSASGPMEPPGPARAGHPLVQLARDHGASTALPAALNFQSTFAET